MTKILVTGRTGFIGSNLVNYLEGKNYPIIKEEGFWKGEYDSEHILDITNREDVEEIFWNHRPELVIHLAARKGSDYCDRDVEDAYNSNVVGMKNIIDACNLYKIPLIHFGTTAYYYSDENIVPINENTLMAPRTFYGITKMLQIYLLESLASFPYMIIEPVFLYGNYGEHQSGRSESVPDVAIELLKETVTGEIKVRIDPQYIKDYTHIQDFLEMFEVVLERPSWGERITIGSNFNRAFIDEIKEYIPLLEGRLNFLGETDYKKHQYQDYSKLYSLYPELKNRRNMSVKEYLQRTIHG